MIDESNYEELKINKITIDNAKIIEHLELKFGFNQPGHGELIEIEGANETGKTTIYQSVVGMFEGGKHPKLIRRGSDAAECVFSLSNGVQMIQRHTPSESTLVITGPDGATIPGGPRTYIKRLANSFACDPLGFDMETDPAKRLKFLLEMSPVRFEPAEISEAMLPENSANSNSTLDARNLVPVPNDVLDLKTFGKFVDGAKERRALLGNRRDEKASTAVSLRKSLPESDSDEAPKNWRGELEGIAARRSTVDKIERDDVSDITRQATLQRATIQSEIKLEEDALHAEHMRKVQALADKRQSRMKIVDELETKEIADIRAKNASAKQNLAAEEATARAAHENQLKVSSNRDLAFKFGDEAAVLARQYESVAVAINGLDTLRKSKVDSALLPGMEIDGKGEIFVDGIPWDEQNQATRYMKAIELCTRGLGELRFFAVDGGERLDPTNKTLFREAVVQSGLQAIICTVASPENIEKYGPDLRSIPASAMKKGGSKR